jgi:hypothetical protein
VFISALARPPKAGSFFFFRVNAGDSRTGNFQNRFLGAPDQKARLAHGGNHTHDPAGGDYFVASLQLSDRFLELSLLFLLRPYQKEIENPKNEDHWQEETKTTRTALKK